MEMGRVLVGLGGKVVRVGHQKTMCILEVWQLWGRRGRGGVRRVGVGAC